MSVSLHTLPSLLHVKEVPYSIATRQVEAVRRMHSDQMNQAQRAERYTLRSTDPWELREEKSPRLNRFFLPQNLFQSEEKTAMMDLCEFNPKFDVDGHTAKLSAMIVANFLAGIANRH